jgi:hypothetical protein
MVFLLERALISWSSAIDEHGEHKNLRGLGYRVVTPYVHKRMKLYCSSLTLPCEPEPFSDLCKVTST